MLRALQKFVPIDIDVVLTDRGMYYDQPGKGWRKFVASDRTGFYLFRELKIPFTILTGAIKSIVERRPAKFEVEYVVHGVRYQLFQAQRICIERSMDIYETAYKEGDLNYVSLIIACGLSCAPAHAPSYIKQQVDFITVSQGCDEVFLEPIKELFN